MNILSRIRDIHPRVKYMMSRIRDIRPMSVKPNEKDTYTVKPLNNGHTGIFFSVKLSMSGSVHLCNHVLKVWLMGVVNVKWTYVNATQCLKSFSALDHKL